MSCTTKNFGDPRLDPCLPGNVQAGCLATIRYSVLVPAGSEIEVEVERPAGARWSQIKDIVASEFEIDATTGLPVTGVARIEDDEGRDYFPRVGSDSTSVPGVVDLAEDVPVAATEFTREVYAGFGSGESATPFADMTLPKMKGKTDKMRVVFYNLAGADSRISGEFKIWVLKASSKTETDGEDMD